MCALVAILRLQKSHYVSICIAMWFLLASALIVMFRHAMYLELRCRRLGRHGAMVVLTGARILVRTRGGMRFSD